MKKLLFLVALSAATPALAQDQVQTPGVYIREQNVNAIIPKAGIAVAALAPVPDGAPFEWHLRLKAGQKFRTTTETLGDSSQQIPAMPGAKTAALPAMMTSNKSRMVVEQNVLSSDEKGARIELTYREMTQTTQIRQGDKVVFDSANAPAGRPQIGEILENLVGVKISYLLSSDGQISDVQGIEEYSQRLTDGLEKVAGQTPEQQKRMREVMTTAISPDVIKSSFGNVYFAMPRKAVKTGESWKYSSTIPMMGTTFNQNGQSTFVSRANGAVTLAQTGDFATDPGAEFKVPMPRDQKTPAPITQLDLHGTSKGEILVDEQSGMTLHNHTTQVVEGELVMNGLTGRGSVMTIPMKVTSEVVSTTEELKDTP